MTDTEKRFDALLSDYFKRPETAPALTERDFEHYYNATTGTDAKLAQAAWRGMALWDEETTRRYVQYRIARREAK